MIRKFLLKSFVMLGVLVVYACSDNDSNSSSFINVEPENFVFEYIGGEETFVVHSSGDWSVSGETDWCTLSISKGTDGAQVVVSVAASETKADRTASLRFVCGEKVAEVQVMQYGKTETNYVDMKFDAENVSVFYDETASIVSVEYAASSDIPSVRKGKAIVLPEEYDHAIRVVESVEVSGNKIVMQTVPGDMCDLFRNIEFTLITGAEDVRSVRNAGWGRVYTPCEVVAHTDEGKSVVLYKRPVRNAVVVDAVLEKPLFSFDHDFKGEEIVSGDFGRLYWEQCKYGVSLDGVVHFSFGEEFEDSIPRGLPLQCGVRLVGKYNADFLLRYEWNREYKKEIDDVIKERIVSVSFSFMVGGVPVWSTVSADLKRYAALDCKGSATMSAGFLMEGEADWGFEYENGNVVPVKEFVPSFSLHNPTFNVEGSLTGKVACYPDIRIKFYNMVGPVIEPMPFLKEELEGGLQLTASGDNYFGWQSRFSSGVDLRLGVALDFFGIAGFSWESDVLPLENSYVSLCEAPAKLELVSPEEAELKGDNTGKEMELTFRANLLNGINKKYYPCLGALVCFESEGETDKQMAVADQNGEVKVKWIPGTMNKGQSLTAKIMDGKGNVIDCVVVKCKREKVKSIRRTRSGGAYETYTFSYDENEQVSSIHFHEYESPNTKDRTVTVSYSGNSVSLSGICDATLDESGRAVSVNVHNEQPYYTASLSYDAQGHCIKMDTDDWKNTYAWNNGVMTLMRSYYGGDMSGTATVSYGELPVPQNMSVNLNGYLFGETQDLDDGVVILWLSLVNALGTPPQRMMIRNSTTNANKASSLSYNMDEDGNIAGVTITGEYGGTVTIEYEE